MFTYQAGEPLGVSMRKTALRSAAREEWSFLTPFDLTMIDSEDGLASMVMQRSGRTKLDADIEVGNWMERQKLPKEYPAAATPQPSWENEGGSLPA